MAKGRIKFIDVKYIKDNSIIEGNVDDSLISPVIYNTQILRIRSILGSDLYTRLQDDIKSLEENGTPIPALYKTLLDDYIAPALLNWSVYELLPYFKIKLTNKGTVSRDGEFSTPSDTTDVKWLSNRIKDFAELLSEDITRYLKSNTTDYPEYSSNLDCDDIKPSSNNFFGGTYFPDN